MFPGSITHPYQTQLDDYGFSRCHFVATPEAGTETYARSLFMLGNGMPVWDPVAPSNRPQAVLESGVEIGDVGYLNHQGHFLTCFNIFSSTTNTFESSFSPNTTPLQPPLEQSEIAANPTHFPPGTVLCSKGVEECVLSASPL